MILYYLLHTLQEYLLLQNIEFIPGKQNVYADFLSRRPIDADPSHEEQVTVNFMFIEGDQFVNASIVASETKRDSVLSKVLKFTQHGWPEKPEPVFQPYLNTVSYTHLRAHETRSNLVCRLLLEKKK